MAGLKLVYGGSIPSFLVMLELVQMLVLQMCDMAEDIREVTRHLWRLVQQIKLLV